MERYEVASPERDNKELHVIAEELFAIQYHQYANLSPCEIDLMVAEARIVQRALSGVIDKLAEESHRRQNLNP